MASQIDIFNIALLELAEATSLDPAQGGVQADLTRRWPTVRDEVIAAHPWNCTLVRTTLAKAASAPAYGLLNEFALPTDPYCLRVWKVGTDRYSRPEWVVEGRKLRTNAAAPLPILYGGRNEDTESWSPDLVNAVAYRLAAAVAYKLTDSRTKEVTMWEKYVEVIKGARSLDGQEGTFTHDETSSIEGARTG